MRLEENKDTTRPYKNRLSRQQNIKMELFGIALHNPKLSMKADYAIIIKKAEYSRPSRLRRA